MKNVPVRIAICPVVLGAVVGCANASGDFPEAVVHDSAGITIVENTGEDRALPWSYEISFRLGGAPEGPEQFYEIDADQVATDSAGNIYVLDATNHRVVKFNRDGNVQWMAGTEGGGPGELLRPYRIHVDHAGTVHVMDTGKDALIRFDSTGTSIDQTPYGSLSDVIPTRFGIFGVRREYREDGVRTNELVAVVNDDTSVIFQTAAVPTSVYRLESCGARALGLVAPVIFGKAMALSHVDRGLVVSGETGYTVDYWNTAQTKRLMSIRRSMPAQPATAALAIQWAEIVKPHRLSRSDGSQCVARPSEVVEKRGFADSLPAIDDIQVDRRGRLWVQRYAIDSSLARIDVFDPEGVYLGALPEGYPWPVAFATPDRILFVEQDEVDIQRLVVAELTTDERGIPMGEPSS